MRAAQVIVLAAAALVSTYAKGGPLLDYLRDYDLNDYALGLAISGEQNPYTGAKNGAYAYPYLTSFTHPALTDDWFFVRDGDVGVRWLSENGWEIGAVGRVQTLGLGNSETDDLLGIEDREWALEVGPMIGWRRWPVHINLKSYAEVSDRHDGFISQLVFSAPFEYSWGFIVPAVDVIHQSKDYVDYYYGVSQAEATPSRPAYQPDDAINTALQVRWGYALSDKWLLSGTFGIENLASDITDSPIVERDHIWSANIGLAYNVNVFQPRAYDFARQREPKFELRVGAFQDLIDSKVARDTSDGIPGFETDIEEFLGAADEKTVLQLDAVLRLGHYHRLEFGYFELTRNGTVTLSNDLSFGDELFVAGTTIDSRINASIFRAGYAYSLIRDAQKELGIMAGVHFSNFETNISAAATGQTETSDAGTPLPVIGAHGSIFIGEKIKIGAKLQLFRMDFDRYEGSLSYGTLDIERRFGDRFNIGLGYNFYRMNLESNDNDVNGYLKVRHHGPVVFLTAGF